MSPVIDTTTSSQSITGRQHFQSDQMTDNKNEPLRVGVTTTNQAYSNITPLIVVNGSINGHVCSNRILLDGGATTSFVSLEFVRAAGLPMSESKSPLNVELADGTCLICDKVVRQAWLQLSSTHSSCDMHHDLIVMHKLSKYDMILGRSFLSSSYCTIDHGNDRVIWRGSDKHNIDTAVTSDRTMHSNERMRLNHLLSSLCKETSMGDKTTDSQSCYVGTMLGSPDQRARLDDVLDNYKRKMEPCTGQLPPDRGEYNHSIRLKDQNIKPIKRPAIPLKPLQAKKMKERLDELLQAGLIRRSKSSWGLPAFMVNKDDGADMRMVVDYGPLNKHVVKNATSLPHIKELVARLSKAKVFSKLDLKSGYNQIRMKEEDVEKTAFTTPFGHYEWLVMPFGECNAPATFVQFLNQCVLVDIIHDYIVVFVDDILVFSENEEDHINHVQAVLERLARHQLFINPAKCKWMVDEVSFLGYHLKAGTNGAMMMAQPHRVEAIKNWPAPKNVKELQSFLGVANFCRMFVKDFATIAKPLSDLTRGKVSQHEPLQWGYEHDMAFAALKQALCEAPALAIPDETKPFTLFTDASDFGIGAMLCQMNEATQTLQPCGFMSAKLTGAMLNWSTFDKECWALIAALDYWSMLLHGCSEEIQVFTDHRALQYILNQPHLNGRQARWIEFLGRFRLSIKYMKGEDNVQADALSRRIDHDGGPEEVQQVRRQAAEARRSDLKLNAVFSNIGAVIENDELIQRIVTSYANDERCQRMIANPDKFRVNVTGNVLINAKGRIIVPNDKDLKNFILNELHDGKLAGHLGNGKTMKRVTDRFWWPGLAVDVIAYVARCASCQRNKDSNQVPMGYLQSLEAPVSKGQVITVDFVGPLPRTARQHDFVMVIVDAFTKRVWYHPTTQRITARQAARVIFDKVVTHQGLPEVIVSDRDPRFTSQIWQQIWAECGTHLAMSSSFHPESDGLTEQHNRVMQEMLRAYVNETGSDWDLHLSALMIAYNSSRHSSTGFTPYELDVGFNPTTPIDIALRIGVNGTQLNIIEFFERWTARWNTAQENAARARERQQRSVNKHRREHDLKTGDMVMLQINRGPQRRSIGPATKLGPRMEGPYSIKRVTGPVSVELELDEGDQRHPVVHVGQLRKFVGNLLDDNSEQAAQTTESSGDDHSDEITDSESDHVIDEPRRGLRQRRVRDRGPFVY